VALAYGAASILAWLLALSLRGPHSTIVMAVVPFVAWGIAVATYLSLRRRWLMKNRKTLRGEG
jgi:hypothetical protein